MSGAVQVFHLALHSEISSVESQRNIQNCQKLNLNGSIQDKLPTIISPNIAINLKVNFSS